MTAAVMVMLLAIAAPAPQQGTALPLAIDAPPAAGFAVSIEAPEPEAPPLDLRREAKAVAAAMVAQEANGWQDAQQPADDGTGYFGMMYGNSYDPAVLSFFAASAVEMYTAYDLRNQCAASTVITCSDPWPSSVQMDALLTAGVYAGVTGLQRLAKTQWDLDMDEGWKNLLIFGGLAAARALVSASNISDANALREFGR